MRRGVPKRQATEEGNAVLHTTSTRVGSVGLPRFADARVLGQDDSDGRSRTELGLDRQAAAMTVDDVLDDRESQSRPPLLTAGWGTHAIEALGQARQILESDARAMVADREP